MDLFEDREEENLNNDLKYNFDLSSMIPDPGDILLVVPPLNQLNIPSLGIHVLQACAKKAGHKVSTLYSSLLFVQQLGIQHYHSISFHPLAERLMLGDRIFAAAAFDTPLLGRDAKKELTPLFEELKPEEGRDPIDYSLLKRTAEYANQFVKELARKLVAMNFSVIGCTNMMHQTAAGVALLKEIKKLNPEIVTIMGGLNCLGDLAKGILSLSNHIDYVFCSDSESAFVQFLNDIQTKKRPSSPILGNGMCTDLNALPTVDFQEYYHQIEVANIGLNKDQVHILYEASRGCWWGEKEHHCAFCGEYEMRYRMKSSDLVIKELKELVRKHNPETIHFTDNVLPRNFFRNLLPRLKKEVPGIRFFCEQKTNISLKNVRTLVEAGAYSVTPGIEALSDSLLQRIDKGVKVRQNLLLMRYARSCDLWLRWLLLYGFPGDQAKEYHSYPDMIPLLFHLNPPNFLREIQIMRFGLYKQFPERYGIKNIKPMKGYESIFPENCDLESLAYYFDADYDSVSTEAPELVETIRNLVNEWREKWINPKIKTPVLSIEPVEDDMFLLRDTRGVEGTIPAQFINKKQAFTALLNRPLKDLNENREIAWALDNKIAIEIDGWFVPLATATPDLLETFESNKTR